VGKWKQPTDGATRERRYRAASEDHTPALLAAAAAAPAGDEPFVNLHARVAEALGGIPASLTGLHLALPTLQSIMAGVKPLTPGGQDRAFDLERWQQRLAALPPDHPLWSIDILEPEEGFDRERATNFRKPVLVGSIGEFPVWAMLSYQSETKAPPELAASRRDAFTRLQAALVGTWIDREPANEPELRKNLPMACRFIRQIYPPHRGKWLDQYAKADDLPGLHAVTTSLGRDEKFALRRSAAAFAKFLGAGLGQSPAPSRPGKRHAKGTSSRRPPQGDGRIYPGYRTYPFDVPQPEPHGENDSPLPSTDVLTPGDWAEKQLIIAGVDPDEFARPATTWIDTEEFRFVRKLETGEEISDLPPIATLYGIGRSRQRGIKRTAQRLTTRRSRITPPELARILYILQNHFSIIRDAYEDAKERKRTAPELRRQLEMLLLAAACLVTGTPVEAMVKLDFWPANAAPPPPEWRIAYSVNAGAWFHPCLRPARQPLVSQFVDPLEESEQQRIAIADAWGVGKHLPSTDAGMPIFPETIATYTRLFDEHVRPFLKIARLDPRWHSLPAFSDLLPSWLQGKEEGDQLRVALLFHRPDRLASTHLYYTAVDPYLLNRWFQGEMQSLWKRLGDCGFEAVPNGLFTHSENVRIDRAAVGDDRMPKVESIRAIASSLRNRLKARASSRDAAVARHNDLTAYVAMHLAVVSGFRPFRTPIPDLRLLDEATGFMPLQEKDQWDGSHARIVWIPPKVRKQISLYCRHLERLHKAPIELAARSLSVRALNHRDQSRLSTTHYDLNLTRTFFFLDLQEDQLAVREFTGESLRKHLEAVSPGCWPVANAGRHLLRTALSHWGCPATLINTHMGHWHLGEASWAPDSCLDPYRLRDGLAPYMARLLEVLEFQIVP
jgi:hypothetical protein